MFVKSDYQVVMKTTNIDEHGSIDRVPLNIITVCRKPFQTMSTVVNEIYFEKTVKEIIEDLVSRYTDATIDYHTEDQNTELLKQVVIPPISLYQVLKPFRNPESPYDGFLDRNFGLYNGVYIVYCNYDNKIYVKNLSKKMNKNQILTVYHLSVGSDNSEAIQRSIAEPDKFSYTYDEIQYEYGANTKYAIMSQNIKHIVKPSDTLYHEITQNLDDVCRDYGLIFQNPKIFVDSEPLQGTTYKTFLTGYEKTKTFANSQISRKLSNISPISFRLDRNVNLKTLMNVGEPIKVLFQSVDDIPLTGKYILKASDVLFNKESEWQAVATLHLIRTNRII